MKKTFLLIAAVLLIALPSKAATLLLHGVDGEVFDTIVETRETELADLEVEGITFEFAGWSVTSDATDPIFYTIGDSLNVTHAVDLYPMFYKTKSEETVFTRIYEATFNLMPSGVQYYLCGYKDGELYFTYDDGELEHAGVPCFGIYGGTLYVNQDLSASCALGTEPLATPIQLYEQNGSYRMMTGDTYLVNDADTAYTPYLAKTSETTHWWNLAFNPDGSVNLTNNDYGLVYSTDLYRLIPNTEIYSTVPLYLYMKGTRENYTYVSRFYTITVLNDDEIAPNVNAYGEEGTYYVTDMTEAGYYTYPVSQRVHVAEGSSVTLYINNYSYLESWVSASYVVSSDNPRYNGMTPTYNESDNYYDPIIIAPSQDMTLKPVYERNYWRAFCQNAEEFFYMPWEGYNSDNFVSYQVFDEDSVQQMVLCIRKGATEPITYTGNELRTKLGHWVSNDSTINGSTDDPLMLSLTSDITLGVVEEPLDVWTIDLPEMTYNDDHTIINVFYREEQEEEEPEAPQPWGPQRMPRNYPFSLEMTGCEQYDDDSCHWAYIVEKGASVTLYSSYCYANDTIRFLHWISNDTTINGKTDQLLTITPTHNLTLSFAYEVGGVITVINGDTIIYSSGASSADTTSLAADGSVKLVMNLEDDMGVYHLLILNNATLLEGLMTELADVVLNTAVNSTIMSDAVGIEFDGDGLWIASSDTSYLRIEAPAPLVGNGLSALYINGRIILSSQRLQPFTGAASRSASFDLGQRPAISGFSSVVLGNNIELQEAWYGEEKGDINTTRFHAEEGMYGTVDIETQSFVPATTLVFADPSFYVDYLEGKIEIDPATGLYIYTTVDKPYDNRCYDILGREIEEPAQGLFIRGGKVYLK